MIWGSRGCHEMGKCPDCREIGPDSSPADGKLRAIECVNALHAHSQICAKMPHVGIAPTTLTHAAWTITKLTKWVEGETAPHFYRLKTARRTDPTGRCEDFALYPLHPKGGVFPFVCKSSKRNLFN